ncbi:TPA_exp: Uncharacterized protein A8136_7062 [Trichophyton benhamiae CBS 112371]|nr:TPA_exp: Uncharacterized protein A8136_7062 [Trichophyton benhamiae CBS 112371]
MPTSNGRGKGETPLNSAGPSSSPAKTPYNALFKLSRLVGAPSTPAEQNATSFNSNLPSAPRTGRRKSGITPSRARGGERIPVTPHAIRALQRRAATYTPGRDRRKSQRFKRETPMDILKNLGKVLAPVSKTVSSSPPTEPEPQSEPPVDEIAELDKEPPIPPPRLSLPLNEMAVDQDDNSPPMPPPRLSVLPDDEDVTRGSIELPRRERSGRDLARLSRVSFASNRFSDHYGDTTNIEDPEDGLDFRVGQEDDFDEDLDNTTGQPMLDAGGETEDLGRFNFDFAFPTPEAPHAMPIENENEQDTFELESVPPEFGGPNSPSSGSDFGTGGFEPAMDDVPSNKGTPEPIEQEAEEVEMEQEDQPEPPQKKQKVSKHGIPVPSLPAGVVKKLAMRFARSGNKKTRITKDTMAAIQQATDWFFEQASGDLSTYSKHSGRKTIDETDVIALMRRQRHVGRNASVFALAQKHLPKELLQDIRLPKG